MSPMREQQCKMIMDGKQMEINKNSIEFDESTLPSGKNICNDNETEENNASVATNLNSGKKKGPRKTMSPRKGGPGWKKGGRTYNSCNAGAVNLQAPIIKSLILSEMKLSDKQDESKNKSSVYRLTMKEGPIVIQDSKRIDPRIPSPTTKKTRKSSIRESRLKSIICSDADPESMKLNVEVRKIILK